MKFKFGHIINFYLPVITCYGASIFVFYFSQVDTVANKNELTSINGIYKKGTYFKAYHGFRYNSGPSYEIKLLGYPNIFRVKTAFMKFFDYRQFDKEVAANSIITIGLDKSKQDGLKDGTTFFIYSIAANGKTYLDPQRAIADDRDTKFTLGPVFFVIMLIVSTIILVYRLKYLKN